MGLSYSEMNNMTLEEWEQWSHGYALRLEDEWRQTREVMAMVHNMAQGIKKPLQGKELVKLPSEKTEIIIPDLDERLRIAAKYRTLKTERKLSATEFLNSVK